jgi:SulP family sulfate permease
VLKALSYLKPNRKHIASDLIAGATFAVVNVPQGMANALLVAVNPVAGLYTLMIAMPVGAIFTGSVFMNVSTTGALSLAAGDALEPYAGDQKIRALIGLVMLIGVIQLAFGLLKFGSLIRFVSHSVMTGFITGIAALIVFGAVPNLTGYASPHSGHLIRLADTIANWRQVDVPTFVVGLMTIGLILGAGKTPFRKFALIIALACMTALVAYWQPNSVRLVGDIAELTRSLPRPMLPDFALLPDLLLPAIAIALIGLIQGAGVGQSYPNPDGEFADPSQDFVGQGAANLAASLFTGIPSGGSMSGTAVNVQAGAQSRWSNIFAGLSVVVIVLAMAGLVMRVPMAGLGGLLFVVGIQNLQPAQIRHVWSAGLPQRVAMLVTLSATLTLPLQYAILLGVAISMLLYVMRTSKKVDVLQLVPVPGGFPEQRPAPRELASRDVVILRVRGSLFFATAQALEEGLPSVGDAKAPVVILILRDFEDIGSTVLKCLKRYAAKLQLQGGALMLVGINEQLAGQFDRTGTTDAIGSQNIFREKPELGIALNEALASARARLAGEHEANVSRNIGNP